MTVLSAALFANSDWAPGGRLIGSLTLNWFGLSVALAWPSAVANVGAGRRKQLGVGGDLFVNVVL